jgi:hypothetical protein
MKSAGCLIFTYLFHSVAHLSLSDLVEKIKAVSSKWIKTKGNEYRAFAWQNGYGAFSLGSHNFGGKELYQKSKAASCPADISGGIVVIIEKISILL